MEEEFSVYDSKSICKWYFSFDEMCRPNNIEKCSVYTISRFNEQQLFCQSNVSSIFPFYDCNWKPNAMIILVFT